VAAGLPLPFLAIELIRFRDLEQEFIALGRASRAERFPPALTRLTFRRNDETIILDTQLDPVAQPALLDEGLRNADAAGIANTNQLCSNLAGCQSGDSPHYLTARQCDVQAGTRHGLEPEQTIPLPLGPGEEQNSTL